MLGTKSKWREAGISLSFIGPILILYICFFIVPLGGSLVYSFTDWDGLQTSFNWVGFQNYIDLLRNSDSFRHSFIFTVQFSLVNIILVNVFGLLLALLVDSKLKSRFILRTIFFSPNVISLIVVGFLWKFFFSSVLYELGEKLHWSFLTYSFLGNPDKILYPIAGVSLWQSVGLAMVIYLAGLQGIPTELKEAMHMDGAGRFTQLLKLIIPLLVPAFISNLFLTTTNSFKVFDLILALTGGGPGGASESLAINIYREAFTANEYGSGTARSIIFCLFIMIIMLIQFMTMKRKEENN
ncbi:carbohydrate ABC transporter permease [Paenibacillus segetis]|uniref:Sugar ABC transporter permease n=1 Tax=Paenibacillus segetis TaxID=1325360 RepID=A0ABQ1Y5P3_9BACL|nr:sugar ABC transporter permease [Paenibacillus segetis]GGH13645.1 sugar ABC transporter permease [Paenibacillus segetis]